MKTLLKDVVASILAALGRGIIQKYKPLVVMVTGSVGKTSTKDAVAAVLGEKFYLRKSEKSFNSEFGVPLTIIGAKNPWANPFGWIGVMWQGLGMVLLPSHFPKLLVLEVGADRPGDLLKTLRIVTPDVVVVTLLPSVPVHVEAYATPMAVREEEFAPAVALPTGAPLIYSADDEYAVKHAARVDAKTYTFGTNANAFVQLSHIEVWNENGVPVGMQAQILVNDQQYKGETHTLHVKGAFGRSQLYAPAAALAVGLSLDITLKQALKGVEKYVPPPGRGRLFKGIKDTVLIDDSYNSSPAAVEEALKSLELIERSRRRVAVLGDMLELGRYSMAEHTRIGHIAKDYVDILVTVGQRSIAIGTAAVADGMSPENLHHFTSSKEAAEQLPVLLQNHDVVLIKGSQSGIRLEHAVKALLANPADSINLVRQETQWSYR